MASDSSLSICSMDTDRSNKKSMRYFLDTEFNEDGKTIELISIGIVAEDGRSYYAQNINADLNKANEWVKTFVIPQLWTGDWTVANRLTISPWRTPTEIAEEVFEFVGEKPEFWAYFADYDWVVLCQLYGRMIDLPKSWPMFCMDLKQLCVHKGNPNLKLTGMKHLQEHSAIADAVWNSVVYDYLIRLPWVA